jgi:hypothetical protein
MMGNIIESDKKAFRNLLRLDVVRGEDSTGVAVIGLGNDDVHLYKKLGAPDNLFNSHEHWQKRGVYDGPPGKVFIGHNRYATTGKVIDDNAHPFHHNTVVGAHNGTLDTVFGLEKGSQFDVDSEAIFYNLDLYDAEDTIGNIDGAYALTWADLQENKFKVIRNKQRPLHWTRRLDQDVIYWASLPWMLELALAYANVNHGPIHEFATDTLYTMDMTLLDEGKARDMKWQIKQNVLGYQWTYKGYSGIGGSGKGNFTTPSGGNNTGGQASTVHPFSGGSKMPSLPTTPELSKDEQSQWAAWVGRDIDFRVKAVKQGIGGVDFLQCYPDDPMIPDMNIHVFAKGKKEWDAMVKGTHQVVYTGKVKRFVRNVVRGKKDYYLAIDLRTIEVKETKREAADTKEDDLTGRGSTSSHIDDKLSDYIREYGDDCFYEGYRGAYLTLKEWNHATKDGCAGCSHDADPSDECMVWIDHQTFLCGDCSTLEVHQSYLVR